MVFLRRVTFICFPCQWTPKNQKTEILIISYYAARIHCYTSRISKFAIVISAIRQSGIFFNTPLFKYCSSILTFSRLLLEWRVHHVNNNIEHVTSVVVNSSHLLHAFATRQSDGKKRKKKKTDDSNEKKYSVPQRFPVGLQITSRWW